MAVREVSRRNRTAGVGVQVPLATTAGADHLGPLATFDIACHRFGHEVVVAAPASFAAAVQRAGFAHAPFVPALHRRHQMGLGRPTPGLA
jgi:hypothetical protein